MRRSNEEAQRQAGPGPRAGWTSDQLHARTHAVAVADKQKISQEILRYKIPATKGLSAETAAAVQAGELEIQGDDPGTEKLREIIETDPPE